MILPTTFSIVKNIKKILKKYLTNKKCCDIMQPKIEKQKGYVYESN